MPWTKCIQYSILQNSTVKTIQNAEFKSQNAKMNEVNKHVSGICKSNIPGPVASQNVYNTLKVWNDRSIYNIYHWCQQSGTAENSLSS